MPKGATTRQLREVTPYLNPAGRPRCKVELESGETVPLHSLSRPELASAARLVFPGIAGNAWLRLPSDKICDLIRDNNAVAAGAVVDAKLAEPKAPKVPDLRRISDLIRDNNAVAAGAVVDAKLAEPKAPKVPDLRRISDYGYGEPVRLPIPVEPEPVEWKAVREQTEPKVAAHDGADALAEALRTALASQSPSLDTDEVKALVSEEVKRQVVDLGVVRIEVAQGNEVRELPTLSHEALPEVVTILAAGLNLFMVGPAGSGKSTIAHQAADALGIAFYALSLGPTTPTSKLFGYMDAQGRYVRTPFREAYEKGGVILLDELDNGHPGLVAEINQATANGYCAFADGMVERHPDCRIVATGNTFGRGPDRLFVGRNILDAATLDRFVTLEIAIDERLESRLARGFATDANRPAIEDWIGYVQQVRRKVESLKLAVIVSPRATIEGAHLLAVGMDVERVKAIRLFAGIGSDVLSKIR